MPARGGLNVQPIIDDHDIELVPRKVKSVGLDRHGKYRCRRCDDVPEDVLGGEFAHERCLARPRGIEPLFSP